MTQPIVSLSQLGYGLVCTRIWPNVQLTRLILRGRTILGQLAEDLAIVYLRPGVSKSAMCISRIS